MWTVLFHPDMETELNRLPGTVAKKLAEVLLVVAEVGPDLGRPLVDTLKGSRFANMKELRFSTDGVWRVAFAFDPRRQAIVLSAVAKQGKSGQRSYARLIATADRRYGEHLARLERTRRK